MSQNQEFICSKSIVHTILPFTDVSCKRSITNRTSFVNTLINSTFGLTGEKLFINKNELFFFHFREKQKTFLSVGYQYIWTVMSVSNFYLGHSDSEFPFMDCFQQRFLYTVQNSFLIVKLFVHKCTKRTTPITTQLVTPKIITHYFTQLYSF